jgi:eukaryotic-like serine/threonine-protein kinase
VPKLIREMRGDLDWIVMKALEKDRSRRYETPSGFAMDVGRYLSGETILARPPSAAYKFRKLIARNKLVFSGMSLIFVLLVVSLIATTRWLIIERQMQEDMRQQLEIARLESLAWSFYFDAKNAEAEQMLRNALVLRRQSHRAELMPVIIDLRLLLLEFANQKKFNEIRPLLSEFVDPALLSKPEYKNLYQSDLFQDAISTLAQHGKWHDAIAVAEELGKTAPTNSDFYHLRAPLLVANGNVEEYRRLCGEIISRFRDTTDPYVADKMAKDCLILPSAGVDLKSVAALADVAVNRGSNAPAAPYFEFCKALAEYRLGHYQAATNWAGRAIQGQFEYPSANAAAVMAMSQFKLNQLENARITLDFCNKVIEEKMPKFGQDLGGAWQDWIIAHALLTEAKNLLGTSPVGLDSSRPKK